MGDGHGFKLAHVGVHANSGEEAVKIAKLFETLFGFAVKEGNSSVFAGQYVEVMKEPYIGAHGHIAISCDNVEKAQAHLEGLGFTFRQDTARSNSDGSLKAIYMTEEIAGFGVHLLKA